MARKSSTKKRSTKTRKKIKKLLPFIKVLSKTKKALFIIAFFLFLSLNYFYKLNTHPFHIDEWAFVRKTYYFDLFFTKRNLKDPRWYTTDAPDQPKLGTYFYGLTFHLGGVKDIEKALNDVGFSEHKPGTEKWWYHLWKENLVNLPQNLVPKLEFVRLARKTAVLFTLAAFVALFATNTKIKGLLFASLSTFLIATNRLMFTFGRRAMTDSMQLFFFFANLLLALLYLKALETKNTNKLTLLSLALGVNAALGVGVKVSGLLIVFFLAIFFAVLIYLRIKANAPLHNLLKNIALASASFAVVFVSLHPYLYHDTLRQFIAMFTNRLEYTYIYRLTFPDLAIYSRCPIHNRHLVSSRSSLHRLFLKKKNYRRSNTPHLELSHYSKLDFLP
jgi:hypothetical protein